MEAMYVVTCYCLKLVMHKIAIYSLRFLKLDCQFKVAPPCYNPTEVCQSCNMSCTNDPSCQVQDTVHHSLNTTMQSPSKYIINGKHLS